MNPDKLENKILRQQHAAHNLQVAHNKTLKRLKQKTRDFESLSNFLRTFSPELLERWQEAVGIPTDKKREFQKAFARGLAQRRAFANADYRQYILPPGTLNLWLRGSQRFAKDIQVDTREQAK